MAAPMKPVKFILSSYIRVALTSPYIARRYSSQLATAESTSTISNEIQTSETVEYPPVKPRYPPGRWGVINASTAWHLHRLSESLRSIPSVKLRLESIAGAVPKILWIVEPFDRRPNNLNFKRKITKTHVVQGLPDIYKDLNVDAECAEVKATVSDLVEQEREYISQMRLVPDFSGIVSLDTERYVTHRLMGVLLRALRAKLAQNNEHLLRSQVDEDVRVETFWNCTGFSGKKNPAAGKVGWVFDKEGNQVGILRFQYRHKPDWQLRTEKPLAPIVPIDDSLCSGQVMPSINYTPATAGMHYVHDRPVSVSGNWVGAPCEWTSLSIHVLETPQYAEIYKLGEKYAQETELTFGLTAGFGSCVAQAYNQGFCFLLEQTYPITTQCLVTDGHSIQLFVYQLNTFQLWNEDGPNGNPRCNIVWTSDRVPLYNKPIAPGSDAKTVKEKGEVLKTGAINEDALKLLLKSVLLKPLGVGERVNLKPYVTDAQDFSEVKKYINNIGEEILPAKKIGRFEYPRNAVYF